jgi:predicted transcriptional regulator
MERAVETRMQRRRAKLDKTVYVKRHSIYINLAYEYEISLHQCDTLEKILEWCHFLSGKRWMTLEVLQRFMELAADVHELGICGHISGSHETRKPVI